MKLRIHVWLESTGVGLLVGAAIFWAATGRESVAMMMSAITLVALGAFQGASKPPVSK